MSHDSYVCGFIKVEGDIQLAIDAIRKLPATSEQDTWPFLTSSMFSYTTSPEYRDRIVHFAASFKDILGSWSEWQQKLETVTRQFNYHEIKMLVEDCYMGDFIVIWTKQVDQHGKMVLIKHQKTLNYRDEPEIESFE
jgi:hypothetical protein